MLNRAMSSTKEISLDVAIQQNPAIIQPVAHSNRSPVRYHHLTTMEALQPILEAGFVIVSNRTSKTHDPENQGFAKHQIRLRKAGAIVVGDCFPEIVVVNAHNGTSAFKVDSGLYRLACSNGLVVSSGGTAELKVSHGNKEIKGRIIEGVYSVIEHSEKVALNSIEWNKMDLSKNLINEFAERALAVRFGDNPALTIDQVLRRNRQEDSQDTLWQVFNTVQENLIKSENFMGKDKNGKERKVRAVNSFDLDFKINKGLWSLAEEYALEV